jgi:flagellar biosynthetic protein FlhB
LAEEDQQDKTEPATSKRLEDARESGKVAKSQEVGSVAILMGSVLIMYFTASYMLEDAKNMMTGFFQSLHQVEADLPSIVSLFHATVWQIFFILGPFFLAALIVAVAANVAQVGIRISPKALKPKFSSINPAQGFKRIFSSHGLVELVKSLVKISVVGWVGWWTIKEEYPNTLPLVDQSIQDILTYWGWVAFKLFLRAGLAWVLLAILDFSYRKWKFAKDMRMTKQQVKDETKQREGDPFVKGRIRGIQRERARQRMMAAVPEADVVITNPTHYAVALVYRPNEMGAPKVVAKGADYLAQQIQVVAREHDVPILQNQVLARSLYSSVEVDQYVPIELYKAVAEVLAYVYRLGGKKTAMYSATTRHGDRA